MEDGISLWLEVLLLPENRFLLTTHEQYMLRCLQLAEKGMGSAPPNPMVGAVLVYENRVIGEGWHQVYGGPHAEVNCLASVKEADRPLVPQSVLYVSLEPCAHEGKTPPCTRLIIGSKIPHVVIGCADPFEAVNGRGVQQLRQAGITVTEQVLEAECIQLNKRFLNMVQHKRPYITLKWALTENGVIGSGNNNRLLISNSTVNRLVHRWRTEEMGILAGFNTITHDNPQLNNRLWPGRPPWRIVTDPQLELPRQAHVFTDGQPTIVFNQKRSAVEGPLHYIRVNACTPEIMLNELYELGIQSVLVEGGAKTLQAFIDAGLWNEARVITHTRLQAEPGVRAPVLRAAQLEKEEWIFDNRIGYYFKQN